MPALFCLHQLVTVCSLMGTPCSSKMRATSRMVSVCEGFFSAGFRKETKFISEWFGNIFNSSELSFGRFPMLSELVLLSMHEILSRHQFIFPILSTLTIARRGNNEW